MSWLLDAQRARILLLTGLLGLVASAASGQQSRAEEIAQAAGGEEHPAHPEHADRAERALDWFEDHFTDPNTVYLTFGGIYPSGGFAPGVAVRGAFGHARLNVGGAYSIRSYKLAHASLNFPDLAGNKLDSGDTCALGRRHPGPVLRTRQRFDQG